ncbi:MAG: hypothetical protein A2289_06645 [Deltaproteobacteria bacterium RIFOXYA12_FULL_58_15]|nr:MAG: hypothetical protein A2289_06645 [Deltaproteobacteria bacterium RIFOXYA12_FULL_58_15]OGR10807.1 MAG: hypothetical protein A2341_24850 [Deltaproteobacteria bacterium RIFOXYB12_FULL_58_9]
MSKRTINGFADLRIILTILTILTILSPLSTSCVAKPPIARLAESTTIAVAMILERDGSTSVEEVPEALRQQTAEKLALRNLVPHFVEHRDLAETLNRTRNTTRRLAKLQTLATDARLLVLVEARASLVAPLIGDRVGALIDRFLGGHNDLALAE